MKAKVCIISGTPGTGKTFLTKLISRKINTFCVFLNELIINERHTLNYDNARETWVVNEKTLIPRLKEIIKLEKRSKNYELIIIEGHLSDLVPSKLIDYGIVLRCHPNVLNSRLEKRNYKEGKIKENVQAEILGDCVSFLLEKKIIKTIMEIDTTNENFEEIAEDMVSIIKNDKGFEKYALGKVDWLEELFTNNHLDEFFE